MADLNPGNVGQPDAVYNEMCAHWDLLHTLQGGTQAMRAAGKKYLPEEPKEKPAAYKNRLNRSFLYGAFTDTVDRLVSKPFSKALVLQDSNKLDKRLQWIEDDVDGAGVSLTASIREYFKSAIFYGLTHVLVDFPSMNPSITLADERAMKARPLFIHVKPPSLIGRRYAKMQNGGGYQLTQVRIREYHEKPVGQFGVGMQEYIRVYTPTEWFVYAKNEDAYDLVSQGKHTFGSVPLFTLYFDRTGILSGRPPLEELAWMNLCHWQSFSDQRNILRIARTGTLFAAGFSQEEMDAGFAWGPTSVIASTNQEAKIGIIEHSGKAVAAGEADLQSIEERMEVLGLQPLLSRSSKSTATARLIDESRIDCDVQAWIERTEDFAEDLYGAAADWLGVKMPKSFEIEINSDFGISQRATDDIKNLVAVRGLGDIDRETFLREIKRRGLLSEMTDIADVIGRIDSEGLPLHVLTEADTGADDIGDRVNQDETVVADN